MPSSSFVSLEDAAQALSVKPDTLRKYINSKRDSKPRNPLVSAVVDLFQAGENTLNKLEALGLSFQGPAWPEDMDTLVSTTDCAALVGVSEATFRRYMRAVEKGTLVSDDIRDSDAYKCAEVYVEERTTPSPSYSDPSKLPTGLLLQKLGIGTYKRPPPVIKSKASNKRKVRTYALMNREQLLAQFQIILSEQEKSRSDVWKDRIREIAPFLVHIGVSAVIQGVKLENLCFMQKKYPTAMDWVAHAKPTELRLFWKVKDRIKDISVFDIENDVKHNPTLVALNIEQFGQELVRSMKATESKLLDKASAKTSKSKGLSKL